jgi:hypothetical protein
MQDKPANRIEELLPSSVAGVLHTQQWVTVLSATGADRPRAVVQHAGIVACNPTFAIYLPRPLTADGYISCQTGLAHDAAA